MLDCRCFVVVTFVGKIIIIWTFHYGDSLDKSSELKYSLCGRDEAGFYEKGRNKLV